MSCGCTVSLLQTTTPATVGHEAIVDVLFVGRERGAPHTNELRPRGYPRESMAFAPRTRLLFLVILLQWPLQLLFVVHACEQCEIDAAESQADGAVAGCVDAWDECDDPKTPQVEGCKDDPPEFLCPALLDSGLCDATFGEALPDWQPYQAAAADGGRHPRDGPANPNPDPNPNPKSVSEATARLSWLGSGSHVCRG